MQLNKESIHFIPVQISKVGVSPMERDNDGATPLHFAAAKGMPTFVTRVLQLYKRLNIQAMWK